jgi:diguanylate cyclase (GGDEF)-like protein
MTALLRYISPVIVDQLAELTRHRDRELLDITLACAFKNLLQPHCVAVYRKIGQPGNERWTTRARLGPADTFAICDPPWVKLNELPLLRDHPARCDALSGRTVAYRKDEVHCIVFPIATDRDVVGVLELETAAVLDEEAHRIIVSMLHVYRNFEALLDYSERDTLTGLLNRKTFDDTFLKVVSGASGTAPVDERRSSQPHDPYFVAMIDIDFFKSVNDRFGHLIGDEVLLLQSRLMRSTFRFQDRLYRFGGEEFLVLMRCADVRGALRAVERLRANTASYTVPRVGQVTVSVGLAQVRAGDSPTAALGRADAAVYFAKAHGRNQVQCHDDLVARGAIAEKAEQAGEVDLF